MDFQRARSKEQIESRQDEILAACADTFREKHYNEIALKDVAERMSLSRTTMYTYYKTKEEIFLDLIKREYLTLIANLDEAFSAAESMDREEFSHTLADAFMASDIMLRLFSIQLTTLEVNCTTGQLASFKKDIHGIFAVLHSAIAKYFPNTTEWDRDRFIVELFIFIQGVHPFTRPTGKQVEAMRDADIHNPDFDTAEICYDGILHLAAHLS